MGKKKKILPSGTLAKVLIVLVIAIALMPVSIEVCSNIASRRIRSASEKNELEDAKELAEEMETLFANNEWVMCSFLSGFSSSHYVGRTDRNIPNYQFVPSDEFFARLDADEVTRRLTAFLDYNREFSSACLLFKPGTPGRLAGRGVALKLAQGESVPHDMLEDADIFESDTWHRVESARTLTATSTFTNDTKERIFSTGLPIYLEDGSVTGEFWLNYDPSKFDELLQQKSEDSYELLLITDNKNEVIMSTLTEHVGMSLLDVINESFDGNIAQSIYNCISNHVDGNVTESHHVSGKRHGYDIYASGLQRNDYKLIAIKTDLEIVTAVSAFRHTLIAVAVASMLLLLLCAAYAYKKFKEQNDKNVQMDGELAMASRIQSHMLPSAANARGESPEVCVRGFQQPAKAVGGDLYDWVFLDGRLAFCIGDVSGKGVPASLLMTVISNLFRHIARNEEDPAAIVDSLNDTVMERGDDSMLCTFFAGVLDTSTGLLKYCNAGHNPPILISGGEAHYLGISPNVPVGAFDKWEWQTEELELKECDRLLLYTDGVTELRNPAGQFYGEERTLELMKKHSALAADQFIKAVIKDLSAFEAKAEQHDDVSLLCIDRLAKPLTLHFDEVHDKVVPIVEAVLSAAERDFDMRLRLAVEEIVQNISDYAYTPSDGPLDVNIYGAQPLLISFVDSGKAFNPLEKRSSRKKASSLEDMELGGWGLQFVREICSDLNYTFKDNKNVFTITYNGN